MVLFDCPFSIHFIKEISKSFQEIYIETLTLTDTILYHKYLFYGGEGYCEKK